MKEGLLLWVYILSLEENEYTSASHEETALVFHFCSSSLFLERQKSAYSRGGAENRVLLNVRVCVCVCVEWLEENCLTWEHESPAVPQITTEISKGKKIFEFLISRKPEKGQSADWQVLGSPFLPPTKKREGPTEQAFVAQSCASKTNMSFTLKTWGGICRRYHGNPQGLVHWKPKGLLCSFYPVLMPQTLSPTQVAIRQGTGLLQLQHLKRNRRCLTSFKKQFHSATSRDSIERNV